MILEGADKLGKEVVVFLFVPAGWKTTVYRHLFYSKRLKSGKAKGNNNNENNHYSALFARI